MSINKTFFIVCKEQVYEFFHKFLQEDNMADCSSKHAHVQSIPSRKNG